MKNRFAKLIYEKRKKLNMKQYHLSDKVGCHQAYICEIEQCKKIPSVELLRKFERVLGFKKGELLKHRYCDKCKCWGYK